MSEGGSVPGWLSSLLLGGSYSYSGSKIWFKNEEGAIFEPVQERSTCSACCTLLGRCSSLCCGWMTTAGQAITHHSVKQYGRKVAVCARGAGIRVESSFVGSQNLSPPPAWARPEVVSSMDGGGGVRRRASAGPALGGE